MDYDSVGYRSDGISLRVVEMNQNDVCCNFLCVNEPSFVVGVGILLERSFSDSKMRTPPPGKNIELPDGINCVGRIPARWVRKLVASPAGTAF